MEDSSHNLRQVPPLALSRQAQAVRGCPRYRNPLAQSRESERPADSCVSAAACPSAFAGPSVPGPALPRSARPISVVCGHALGIAETQRCGWPSPRQLRDDCIPRERSSRRAASRRCLSATRQSPARRSTDERFAMNALVGGPAGRTIAMNDSRRAQADRSADGPERSLPPFLHGAAASHNGNALRTLPNPRTCSWRRASFAAIAGRNLLPATHCVQASRTLGTERVRSSARRDRGT